MKLIITKYHNKIEFLKFIREEFSRHGVEMTLVEAVGIANNLPYVISDIDKYYAESLKRKCDEIANCTIEAELGDDEYQGSYNCNINPPESYIKAMAWYDTLSDQEKQNIDHILDWRSRPAVC